MALVSDDIYRVLSVLEIAHHIPGRIRLKLTPMADSVLQQGAGDMGSLRSFIAAVERSDGISSVKVNVLAKSCTVEYSVKSIDPSAWNDLVENKRNNKSDALMSIIMRSIR